MDNPTAETSTPEIEAKLQALVKNAEELLGKIKRTNESANVKIQEIKQRISQSLESLERGLAELDKAEQEAVDDFDELILEQAEESAKEE